MSNLFERFDDLDTRLHQWLVAHSIPLLHSTETATDDSSRNTSVRVRQHSYKLRVAR